MRILPKEKYAELNDMIESVRAQYPVKKYELSSEYNRVKIWVEDNSRSVDPNDIADGKSYGLVTLSDMANAYSEKEGKWWPFHGDIYITIWRWSNKARRFLNKDAWGGETALSPEFVHYMIELP